MYCLYAEAKSCGSMSSGKLACWTVANVRIDVGGKLLTNHLKHLISFRQWNVLDQTHVVNDVREACGYVSMDWRGDIEKTK